MREEQEYVSLLHDRLDTLRNEAERDVARAVRPQGTGHQARVERDVGVAERTDRLAALDAVGSGLCFGRIDLRDGTRHHIGRAGIREDDAERTPLLVDWRAPVARPFYLATGHEPMGLRRRRHISTEGRTVTALHDEILDLDDATRTGHEDPGGDAVLLAALGAARTGRMTDIVRTIQAEQDRIIRAPRQGILVVEGGPGTGKTAVALHRAAYLLYEHREQLARRAVLIVGPNPAFLGYIGEVLPSLGETGVLLATVGELFPGVRATGTDTPAAAEVKGRAAMADVLARAVHDRQRLPEALPDRDFEGESAVPEPALEIDHDTCGPLWLHREMAHAARDRARATGLPHNLARPHFAFHVIDALTAQLADRLGADPYGGPNLLGPDDIAQLGKEIATSGAVHAAIDELWPSLTPEEFLADFLAGPERQLPEHEAAPIRRDGGPWTPADVPLLDEAAELLGVDDSAEQAAAEARRQEEIAYAQGVLDLSQGSESFEFEGEESEILAAHDVIDAERMAERQEEADRRSAAERAAADRTWAFGHIIVDEAQELSAMAWRLLMRRCPSRSMTLVGDPAQTGDPAGLGSWERILGPYAGDRWQLVRLGVNYRTPAEIMERAAAVRRAADPRFEPPRSVRSTGVEPWTVRTGDPARAVREAVARESARGPGGAGAGQDWTPGRIAVIAPRELHGALGEIAPPGPVDLTRPVVLLDPREAKGLEFDTVIVVEPARFGASDLYVALTRATQRLGVVHRDALPAGLG
ncbi:HelD family protein [Streptomyces clavuligerus]|uniref:HelD family protein n=1 Tax=Streptomyces clavuligerus TaxID=1901 RepID=UPI0002FBEC29|nr:UvrD-helicase domain-containing protein [Streptomyces clavuligerus]ANW18007.1 helicase [Streptomyces clavuligerus]AXU12567.1 helicase [Streptomyces clavuligerus]MBY6302466.1 AAA family ATPase [Streptomyces clavuligerus]QCS05348.1 helicase [Streptomyces clavuligerus]QPJ96836.1 AAA family ATPase [Streptomyces clavuligerus]